jgi:molybdopterin converting factor small subunit
MAVDVHIPAMLRAFTSGAGVVAVDGATVESIVADLDERYPGIRERLLDESGLRRYVNVYVNGRDVRFTDGLATQVTDADDITILPAVAEI